MNWRMIGLGLLVAAQVAVPLRMIQQRETVLREGELFRFKTQPIDPADPFQGRYVWLNIEKDTVLLPKNESENIEWRSSGYATLSVDDEGFAYFSDWTEERPDAPNYLKTKCWGSDPVEAPDGIPSPRNPEEKLTRLHIDIPFTRFYMDEAKAPLAEIRAREATQNKDCWVEVRILNGKAVIEDVIAEGQSLRDLASAEK
jgi:uncharacterized membrane-anchored protein